MALDSRSEVEVFTNVSSYSATLTGEVGYSFCSEVSGSSPCPFYLGSFEGNASILTVDMTCDDSTTATATLSDLEIRLSQPAFGISQGGAPNNKSFPAGALIFESSFDLGSTSVKVRGPNQTAVYMTASTNNLATGTFPITFDVPCNTSKATLTAHISVITGSTLGAPPIVTNSTATSGTCGNSRSLTANVTDPDGDAGAVRWFVDGVLMAPGTTSVFVTGSVVVAAMARDARGATTIAKKTVSCP